MIWAAIALVFMCVLLQFMGQTTIGILVGLVGVLFVVVALATGKVKFLG